VANHQKILPEKTRTSGRVEQINMENGIANRAVANSENLKFAYDQALALTVSSGLSAAAEMTAEAVIGTNEKISHSRHERKNQRPLYGNTVESNERIYSNVVLSEKDASTEKSIYTQALGMTYSI
jgi:hypothetical protein